MGRDATFSCPQCERSYRWKPKLAGRRVRCKCGGAIEVPAVRAKEAEGVSQADGAAARGCPQCGEAVSAEAVLCVSCGYHLESGQQVSTNVAEGAESPGSSRGGGGALKKLGRAAGTVAMATVLVSVLYGFSPYLEQTTGETRYERERAERLLERYTLEERLMHGAAMGAAGGVLVAGLVAGRRWWKGKKGEGA